MTSRLFLFALLLLQLVGIQHVVAQRQLAIQKKNGGLVRFYEGEQIKVRHTSLGWVKGELEFILKDSIIVEGRKMPISEVDAIRVSRPFLAGNGVTLITAGVLWPGVVTINGMLANVEPLLPTRTIVSSVAMLGGGIALVYLGRRTYYTHKGHRFLTTLLQAVPAAADSLSLNPTRP